MDTRNTVAIGVTNSPFVGVGHKNSVYGQPQLASTQGRLVDDLKKIEANPQGCGNTAFADGPVVLKIGSSPG